MKTVTFRKDLPVKRSTFEDLPDFYEHIRENTDFPLLMPVSPRSLSKEAKAALKKARTAPRSRFANV